MLPRVGFAVVLSLLLAAATTAQVVRFETTVGDFDMVLNPADNPRLQGHVDNMLRYVEENRYLGSWINRAAEGFVLQMGGFFSHTKRPPLTIASTRPVFTYNPIEGEPAAEIAGLSNTVGTVAMALPGDGFGGTNQDGGTSSFFVNLATNDFLDADFTVFAAISDMTVINEIMALTQVDRTTDPMFGANAGNLAFSDVPLRDNGYQVFIKRAYEITDTLAVARARAGVESLMASSAATAGGGAGGGSSARLLSTAAVPEPASGTLLLLGALTMLGAGRRASCHH